MIVLDLVLIPSYGISGAAWAAVIAYAVTLMHLIVLVRWKQSSVRAKLLEG